MRLPVGEHQAILIPRDAVITRSGLDFVRVTEGDEVILRSVVVGPAHDRDGTAMVHILTGLQPGDVVVSGDE